MEKRLSLIFMVFLWISVLNMSIKADKENEKGSTKKVTTRTTGRLLTTTFNCNRNKCQNDGNCAKNGTCICKNGYVGFLCQYKDLCIKSNPCLNGGSCRMNNLGQANCTCTSGFAGQYCEIKTACNTINCSNSGTCYLGGLHNLNYNNNNILTDEWCNCTAGFTGSLCNIADVLPSLIWTPNEQCKSVLGDEFIQSPSSPIFDKNVCTNLLCVSKSSTDQVSTRITPSDGTICGPGALCYNMECVNFIGAPQSLGSDETINGVNCNTYLSSSTSALTFCQSPVGNVCKTSCKKYLQFTCNDTLSVCPLFASICNLNVPGSTQLVSDACPFTCNNPICTDIPLRCGVENICLNGGTCQDAAAVADGSKFGFECLCQPHYFGDICQNYDPCDPSPCDAGLTCTPLSTFNYACQ